MDNIESLPETIRHDVAFLAWRIGRCEAAISEMRQERSRVPDTIQTPIGKLPLPIVLAVAFWLMYYYPDKVIKWIGL